LSEQCHVPQQELQYFLEYAAQFLGNLGNYKGFGDSKFVPRCSKDTIKALASKDSHAQALCQRCIDSVFADGEKPALMHLGFPGQGHMSNYYPDSPNITQQEIERIDKFVGEKGLLPENVRMRKTTSGDYEILIASATAKPPLEDKDTGKETAWDSAGELKGKRVSLLFGDHQEEMVKIALDMKKAGQHAANNTQKRMTDEYAKSFETGSLKAFKESQKLWVKDLGPEVESNIGFIETYRDPAGVRAEWEGMVAMVNKERTLAFKKLVDAAPSMIPKLPWTSDFEKDTFTPPDFTSLEVLSFPSSGIPAGSYILISFARIV